MNNKFSTMIFLLLPLSVTAQKLLPGKVSDTGQSVSYTTTPGEDADFIIHPMSFNDHGDGTITDNNTGLMWQKTDGGETSFENAILYCSTLNLGGYRDWRLPTSHEFFGINHFGNVNPALNTVFFNKTAAEYWWTSDQQADNAGKVWVVNAGGGIGAHAKTETISSGGIKRFHVRAVRNPYSTTFSASHFTDHLDGAISDNFTGLVWQKSQSSVLRSWEEALTYAADLSLREKPIGDYRI